MLFYIKDGKVKVEPFSIINSNKNIYLSKKSSSDMDGPLFFLVRYISFHALNYTSKSLLEIAYLPSSFPLTYPGHADYRTMPTKNAQGKAKMVKQKNNVKIYSENPPDLQGKWYIIDPTLMITLQFLSKMSFFIQALALSFIRHLTQLFSTNKLCKSITFSISQDTSNVYAKAIQAKQVFIR